MQHIDIASADNVAPTRGRSEAATNAESWSFPLLHALANPDGYIATWRDGELFIEPYSGASICPQRKAA